MAGLALPRAPQGYYETPHPAVKLWRENRGIEDLSDREIRRTRTADYGLATEIDRLVGRILEALKQAGLERNTAVIYTSDHGDMGGENGMWWKNSFYEGSVGGPLIVSCPARFQPDRRAPQVASLVDIGPTVMDIAGAGRLPGAAGRGCSIWKTILTSFTSWAKARRTTRSGGSCMRGCWRAGPPRRCRKNWRGGAATRRCRGSGPSR